MSDPFVTDFLLHEWNGDECKHGCLCVHSIHTHNNLCPNRVHELQQRYAKLKIERDEMWLTLLNEQGAGEPPEPGWFAATRATLLEDPVWHRNGVGTVRRFYGKWEWRLSYAPHPQYADGWKPSAGTSTTARQAIRDAVAQQRLIDPSRLERPY